MEALVDVPVLQKTCLYEVDLSQLFLDENTNRKLALFLASISNNSLNESYLKSISADPRHCLYVLIDPIEWWRQVDIPTTLYCAIQVYLEGGIPDSTQEDENVGNAIAKIFEYYPQLNSRSLVGARIVQLFQISDAISKDGYGSAALDNLTRFYDGKETINLRQEGALINPQKKWAKIHYIGTYINFTVNDVSRWEGYRFFLFFVGILMHRIDDMRVCVMFEPLHDYALEISGNNERCSFPILVEQSRVMFLRNLSSIFRNLDHELALRLLKSFSSSIKPRELQPHAPKLWEGIDLKRVEAFIESPKNFQLITHLVAELAMVHFTGKLPIELSHDEEVVLLLSGLQMHTNLLFQDNNNARSNLRNIFEKTLNFHKFTTLV